MPIPLDFDDFSLWMAITAIVLLITSELLSPYHGRKFVGINTKRLRNVALATSLLFLSTVIIRIIDLFT